MSENSSDTNVYGLSGTNLTKLEEKFSQPMPLIGVYIAVASLICTLAMAADLFNNIRRRRLWFPCSFFALNAASLTVIAVAMKLPVDLNNPMDGFGDQEAKLRSACFLCILLANFMPSLAAMNDAELLSNMVALAILVITISVNLCMEISTDVIVNGYQITTAIIIFFQLFTLVVISCSALSVSISKKVLEKKYQELHRSIVAPCNEGPTYDIGRLKEDLSKYWVMAVTSSPQFVMVCSEASSTCGAICFLLAFKYSVTLILDYNSIYENSCCNSVYGNSIQLVNIVQKIGLILGSMAPIFRMFSSLNFKFSAKCCNNYLKVFNIESYWTERLEQWKQMSPFDGLQIGRGLRKFTHFVKNLILNVCVMFVIVIVVWMKITRLFTNLLVIFLFNFYLCIKLSKKLLCMFVGLFLKSHDCTGDGSASQLESASQFVLQLQDEMELSRTTLKNIVKNVNEFIKFSTKRGPEDLMELLEKSKDFNGVLDFDDDKVPSLGSKVPPNCWSLTVINLTAVVVALPNVGQNQVDHLLNGVKEGLLYVKQIESTLDMDGDLSSIQRAYDLVWPNVELWNVWLKINLKNFCLKPGENTLHRLSREAKAIVTKENCSTRDQENLGEWSINAIVAHSMYRICETMMLSYHGSDLEMNKKLFEHLSKTIADILSACLTNLPRCIALKCYCSPIEKREESIRTAACLFGETEEIMKVLSPRELPDPDLKQMASIDMWRQSMKARG